MGRSGVHTEGNSSAIVDGAGAVIVASGETVRREGRKPLARIVGAAVAGVPPEIMGSEPAPAIRELLAAEGTGIGDVGRFDVNEAFGAQALAVEREIEPERFNTHSVAIAIGHPLGPTGNRCTLTVARAARRQGVAILLDCA